MIFFSIKFRNAKSKLDEPQKAISTEIFKSASHGFKSLSIILVLLLILSLIFFKSLDNIIYLVFFSITFICHTLIFFKLKTKLMSSELPNSFIKLIMKANFSYLAGLLLVIASLAGRVVVWVPNQTDEPDGKNDTVFRNIDSIIVNRFNNHPGCNARHLCPALSPPNCNAGSD